MKLTKGTLVKVGFTAMTVYGVIVMLRGGSVTATPQFAREYKMECASCHTHVPKLNALGEQFLANGYSLPGHAKAPRSIPVSVWASLLEQNLQSSPEKFKGIPNRIELISAGRAEKAKLSYFIEWRALSREILADGSVRDRSGRFEDVIVTFDLASNLQAQLGQFRALSQIDVSRRLSLSEPLVFSNALPGRTATTSRRTGLRGFSPSGRAPSLRLISTQPDRPGSYEGWYGVLTVPFPGEFSAPLTQEARTTASFEFEGRPKGLFAELYRKQGLSSFGLNTFLGDNNRQYYGLVGQYNTGPLFLEGGVARAVFAGQQDWRYSATLDWIANSNAALGIRFDHRDAPGQRPLWIPYFSFLLPGKGQALKLVVENRYQHTRKPQWAFELSYMF